MPNQLCVSPPRVWARCGRAPCLAPRTAPRRPRWRAAALPWHAQSLRRQTQRRQNPRLQSPQTVQSPAASADLLAALAAAARQGAAAAAARQAAARTAANLRAAASLRAPASPAAAAAAAPAAVLPSRRRIVMPRRRRLAGWDAAVQLPACCRPAEWLPSAAPAVAAAVAGWQGAGESHACPHQGPQPVSRSTCFRLVQCHT